jgi:hypothetical protein
MDAAMAASYVGERSVEAFRRASGPGRLYSAPTQIKGKGQRWLKDALDEDLDRIHCRPNQEDENWSLEDLL